MKRDKKIVVLLVLAMLSLMLSTTFANQMTEKKMQIGDYIEFGNFEDQALKWRIINIDEEGDYLLFCEYIVTQSAFMSSDKYRKSDSFMNRWDYSDTREWLNSSGKMFERTRAESVGFLHDTHFSNSQIAAMKYKKNKTVMPVETIVYDVPKIIKGTQHNKAIRYENIETRERVFLLSKDEFDEWVVDRRYNLRAEKDTGHHMYVNTHQTSYDPNPNYIFRSSYKNLFDTNNTSGDLLGSYNGTEHIALDATLIIGDDDPVYSMFRNYKFADSDYVGIRPSLVLKKDLVEVESGNGKSNTPYLLEVDKVDSNDKQLDEEIIDGEIVYELSKKILNLSIGEVVSTPLVGYTADTNIVYESEDKDLLSVDENGRVEALKTGRGKIKIRLYKTGFKDVLEEVEVVISKDKNWIGKYIEFGKYKGESIIWHVYDVDENKNPIMMSSKLLDSKIFDAPSVTYNNGLKRKSGSDEWEISTLRQWLNSSKDKIDWLNGAPTDTFYNLNNPVFITLGWGKYKGYEDEKGFLHNDNFTEYEKNVMLDHTYKTLLNNGTSIKQDGFDIVVDKTTGNTKKNYYRILSDKVFLLSKEENKDREASFATGSNLDLMQSSLVEFDDDMKSSWERGDGIASAEFWTRDLNDYNFITGYSKKPVDNYKGVSPSIVLDTEKVLVISGAGTMEDPLKVETNVKEKGLESVDLRLNDDFLLLEKGEVKPIVAEVTIGSSLSFNPEDDTIVKVDENGVVTALKEGATTIRVTAHKTGRRTIDKKVIVNVKGKGLEIGDLLYFGQYNNYEILWRVVNIDAQGNPLVWTEYVIGAKSVGTTDSKTDVGGQDWSKSTLKQWLNSSDDKVTWLGSEPTNENLGYNKLSYDEEPGFLSSKNFTALESDCIINSKVKNYLPIGTDTKRTEGGSQYLKWHKEGSKTSGYVQWDFKLEDGPEDIEKAYYTSSLEKVFILSSVELYDYLASKDKNTRGKYSSLYSHNNNLGPLSVGYTLREGSYFESSHSAVMKGDPTSSDPGLRVAMRLDASKLSFRTGAGVTHYPYYATGIDENTNYADKLSKIQVFKGTGKGYELERNPTRLEGLVMMLRMLGREDEIAEQANKASVFNDVPQWGVAYTNYAYDNGLTAGIGQNKFGPDEAMSAASYLTFMLRALGYDDRAGDFEWSNAIEFSLDHSILSVDEARYYQTGGFRRGHVAKISFDTLKTEKKSGEKLVTALIKSGDMDKSIAESIGLSD